MRSLEDYLKLPYTVETKKESDGSYFIKVKELPGCMSVGESIEEAYAMIEDAKADWIQSCLDAGQIIPEPEEDNVRVYSGKFMVRISSKLHQELSDAAEKYGVSLNHLVSEILSQGNGMIKGQQKTIDYLMNKVSPVPPMLSEKRGDFERTDMFAEWAPKDTSLRPKSSTILGPKTRKNRRTVIL